MHEFEDPARRDVLDEQGEFGKGEGEQVVQLVDQAGALPHNRLEPAGDLAQRAQFGGQTGCGCGPLAEGEARGRAGLDGIRFFGAEQGGAIVLVALRVAARDGDAGAAERGDVRPPRGQPVQEVQQVVGVLAGGVETDDKGDGGVALGDPFEPLPKLAVAVGGLGEGQFVGRGLPVVAQEGGVVAVARGVDADADTHGWRVVS